MNPPSPAVGSALKVCARLTEAETLFLLRSSVKRARRPAACIWALPRPAPRTAGGRRARRKFSERGRPRCSYSCSGAEAEGQDQQLDRPTLKNHSRL